MITDPAIARAVFNATLKSSALLDRSIADHQGSLPPTELARYKLAVGTSMATIYEQILAPIAQAHPAVVPETWHT